MAGRDWPQVEGGPAHAAAARPAGQSRVAPVEPCAGGRARRVRQLPSSPRSSPRADSLAAGLAASRVAPAMPGTSIAVDLLRTRTVQAGDQSRTASAGRGWAMLRWLP